MPKIRHEINIVNGETGLTGDLPYRIFLYPTNYKYSGAISYYFEVYTTSSITVTLHNTYNSNRASITGIGYSRVAITTPMGSGEFHVNVSGTGLVLARLLIIQDTGTNPLELTEEQFEIGGLLTTTAVSTAPAALTNPKYWKYNAANFDGQNITVCFHATISNSSTRTTTAQLQSSPDLSTWTNVTDGSVSVTPTTAGGIALVRSSAITLTDGYYYRVVLYSSSSMYSASLYNAKIVIRQSNLNFESLADGDGAAKICGDSTAISISQTFKTVNAMNLSKVDVLFNRVGSPTDNLVLNLKSGSIDGTSLGSVTIPISSITNNTNGEYVTFEFAQPISLSAGTTYWLHFTRSGTADSTNYVSSSYNATGTDTYADGVYSYQNTSGWYSPANTGDLPFRLYEDTDTSVITKFEEQYLLLNSGSSSVGLQNRPTQWDSSEWSGVTNVYRYVHDAVYMNDRTKLVDITADPDADIQDAGAGGETDQADLYLREYYFYSGGGTIRGLTNTQSWGQSFLNNSACKVKIIKIKCYADAGADGNLTVKLYSGSMGGTLLGTSASVLGSDVTTLTSGEYMNFVFSTSIELSASTTYYFSIETDSVSTNYVYALSYGTGTSYTSGTLYRYSSGAWNTYASDMIFGVYSNEPITMPVTTHLIDTNILTGSSTIGSTKIIVQSEISTSEDYTCTITDSNGDQNSITSIKATSGSITDSLGDTFTITGVKPSYDKTGSVSDSIGDLSSLTGSKSGRSPPVEDSVGDTLLITANRNMPQSITDSIGDNASYSNIRNNSSALSESIGDVQSEIGSKALNISITDSIGDDYSQTGGKYSTNSITSSNGDNSSITLNKNISQSISDSIGDTSTQTGQKKTGSVLTTDSLGDDSSQSGQKKQTTSITDSVGDNATQTEIKKGFGSITDTNGDSASITGVKFEGTYNFETALSDTLGDTSTLSVSRGNKATLSDSIGDAGTVATKKLASTSASDTLGDNENVSALKKASSGISDTIGDNADVSSSKKSNTIVSDTIGDNATLGTLKNNANSVSDSIGDNESIGALKKADFSISESLGDIANTGILKKSNAIISDSIGDNDTLSTLRSNTSIIDDSAGDNYTSIALKRIPASITDSLGDVSTQTGQKAGNVSTTDSLGDTSSESGQKKQTTSIIDLLGDIETNSATKHISISITDSTGDGFSLTYAKYDEGLYKYVTISDSLGDQNSLNALKSINTTLTYSAGDSSNSSAYKNIDKATTDSLGDSTTLNILKNSNTSITDSLGDTSTQSGIKAGNTSIIDSLGDDSSQSGQKNKVISITDSVGDTETITATKHIPIPITDSAGDTFSLSYSKSDSGLNKYVTISDSIGDASTLSGSKSAGSSSTSSNGDSDSSTGTKQINVSITSADGDAFDISYYKYDAELYKTVSIVDSLGDVSAVSCIKKSNYSITSTNGDTFTQEAQKDINYAIVDSYGDSGTIKTFKVIISIIIDATIPSDITFNLTGEADITFTLSESSGITFNITEEADIIFALSETSEITYTLTENTRITFNGKSSDLIYDTIINKYIVN